MEVYKIGRKSISSGSPTEEIIGFSRAVRVENIISISGTAAIVPDGATACPDNLYGQIKYCIEIMKNVIEKAGGKIEDVTRTRIMLRDISKWEEAARLMASISLKSDLHALLWK